MRDPTEQISDRVWVSLWGPSGEEGDTFDFPSDVRGVFVEVDRYFGEDIPDAVAPAAAALESVLAALDGSDERALFLAMATPTYRPYNRLQALKFERRDLWAWVEEGDDGVRVPDGVRSQPRLSSEDGPRWVGHVRFGPDQLAVALGATSRRWMVYIGSEDGADLNEEDVGRAVLAVGADSIDHRSFRGAVLRELGRGTFVAHMYGAFDDRDVGVVLLGSELFVHSVARRFPRRRPVH